MAQDCTAPSPQALAPTGRGGLWAPLLACATPSASCTAPLETPPPETSLTGRTSREAAAPMPDRHQQAPPMHTHPLGKGNGEPGSLGLAWWWEQRPRGRRELEETGPHRGPKSGPCLASTCWCSSTPSSTAGTPGPHVGADQAPGSQARAEPPAAPPARSVGRGWGPAPCAPSPGSR